MIITRILFITLRLDAFYCVYSLKPFFCTQRREFNGREHTPGPAVCSRLQSTVPEYNKNPLPRGKGGSIHSILSEVEEQSGLLERCPERHVKACRNEG